PAGGRQTWHVTGLDVRTHYWVALRARDEFGNSGPVSNAVDDVTLEPPRISLSATELSASSTTGNVVRQAIELATDSPGTLEWSAPAPAVDFAGAQSTWPAESGAKGTDGAPRGLQTEAAGGPDAFGYRWSDSTEPGGPVFQWVDVVKPANAVTLTGDEAVSAP